MMYVPQLTWRLILIMETDSGFIKGIFVLVLQLNR
jgi:hypothetical protein